MHESEKDAVYAYRSEGCCICIQKAVCTVSSYNLITFCMQLTLFHDLTESKAVLILGSVLALVTECMSLRAR